MERILKTENYTLIFSNPDLILYGFIDGNLCVYKDKAEEFAKSFFSKDIISREYQKKDLRRAKYWLVGILYHERKNSIPEIDELTGYKKFATTYRIVKRFGPARSRKEGTELAFQKRYGKSISEVMKDSMKNTWKIMNGDLRNKISSTTSEGMKRFWEERREKEKIDLKY